MANARARDGPRPLHSEKRKAEKQIPRQKKCGQAHPPKFGEFGMTTGSFRLKTVPTA
jgi:hypothetical protein